MKRMIKSVLLVFGVASQAQAQETTTYSYDALGRLTVSKVSGAASNGTETTIGYDAAGNRSNYKVTGASNTVPQQQSARFIVVPLNGFTIIPLPTSNF